MIKRESIDKLLDIIHIEEIVGDYVNLKKRGANHIGLCPFHDEKTPSFSVSATKGIFKCFGCGESGNAIGFVMKHNQLSFPDAVREIAQKYNFELEETQDSESEKQLRDTKESLYIINQFAQRYYQDNLFHTDEGKSIGLSYFKERGFTEKTIQEFGLGYALEGFHNFLNTATKQQYDVELLKKAGLIGEKNNNLYDFFRDRVMFPIHNSVGKIVAFAGRTLKSDKKIAKYVNTAETDIYNKSRILYGLYQAKKEIRKQDSCLIVEGYTDVISLHQAGVKNVVASSGTSLTKEHVKIIKRYTNHLILLFDGDAAGIKAGLRGVDIILPEDVQVSIVPLPEAHDPDSFVRELGYEEFQAYIQENKKDFILFKLQSILAGDKKDPTKRAEATKSVIESIALVPDSIKRAFYIRECSDELQIDEQLLHIEVNKARREEFKRHKKITEREKRQLNQLEQKEYATQPQGDHEKLLEDKSNFVEKEVLRVLLEYGKFEWEEGMSVAEYILYELNGQEFKNEAYQKVLNLYRTANEKNEQLELKELLQNEDQQLVATLIEITDTPYELSYQWKEKYEIFITTEKEKLFEDEVNFVIPSYILFVTQRRLEEKMDELKTIEEASQQDELLTQIHHLKQIIKENNDNLKRNYYLH